MRAYRRNDRACPWNERSAAATGGSHYRAGDVASRDTGGCITYVGRIDDVIKASDHRISPFELESVLIEHEAAAEAAVIPSPGRMRLAVPKALVTLSRGYEPHTETTLAIMSFARVPRAPYQRIRRLQFGELPNIVSGKIRRVELRDEEYPGSGTVPVPAIAAHSVLGGGLLRAQALQIYS